MRRLSPLLAAFLPLVAFYLVEDRWGLKPAILVAMSFSAAELAWGLVRHRRVEALSLFSAALVGVLGGLSLLSEDERFVLFTPVIGDAVLAGVLAVTVLRRRPLLLVLALKQDPQAGDHPARVAFLGGMTARLALNLALHGGVTAWSASESRETWLFVSGPLQYVMLGAQVLGEMIYARFVVLPRLERDGAE